MRTLFVTSILLLAFGVLIYAETTQWGRRVFRDRLLSRGTIANNSLPVPVKSAVFQYSPPRLGAGRSPNVTYIVARDNVKNGRGGLATLVSGGVNRTQATIRLTSRPYGGFNFTVEVYGK
ncbi:uncharacterized protein LOC131693022 [Topomyia yanbarensis]|uniref:uncharacterized protein LOC131693022 n=1 Tax=Topomyia yanbarensis TaxID=2498891 RepID=UPI00273CA5F1|nr:uncharacterized protein LOC131693022 [Topomyia yanbarensis]